MQVLIVDAGPSFDTSFIRTLRTRGCETTVSDMTQALTLIHELAFDCILLDAHTPPPRPSDAVAEIRQFIMTSAVAFLIDEQIESLIEEVLADGSVELMSSVDAIANMGRLKQPALLAGRPARPHFTQRLRYEQLPFSIATTLQLTMNLLVDGWCQVILLEVDVPALGGPDKVAVFHRIDARHLAILASGDPGSPGITCSRKPSQPGALITLIEHAASARLNSCGLREIV